MNFESTTVALPLPGRRIVRHSIRSVSAHVAPVLPWFTPEVVHLQDAPSGKAIRLHTGGQAGNMHSVLPFHTASGKLLAAVYSLKQRRLTIGVCGSRRNRHAAFEPWVVRQGASLAVKYAHGESPYYTSPIEGMDQLVHPQVLEILRDGIAMHRLLARFPADLRREILRRLQISEDDTPTRMEGLRLLALCLLSNGPEAVRRMIKEVERASATGLLGDAETRPMPMNPQGQTTMEMPLIAIEVADTSVLAEDRRIPLPTSAEAVTVPGDPPFDYGLLDGMEFPTVVMPLPVPRRAMAIMGSGVKGTVHDDLRE